MTLQQGTVALVGSGEFLSPIEPLDRLLLSRINGTPRVVILPTASAPDGRGVPEHWAQMGTQHFTRLGVSTVTSALVLTRTDANDEELARRIAASNFVYLSGGKPLYLLKTLQGTACWRAIEEVFTAGGVVAGCSAGAMALAGHLLDWPRLWHTVPGLGLAPGLAVVPHFDEIPSWLMGSMRLLPSNVLIAGIEGSTALVGSASSWTVLGQGSVTLFERRHRASYKDGEHVQIESI